MVQHDDGNVDGGTLLDLTRRLVGSTVTSPDEDHCDLIVQPAGTEQPDVGDRDGTFVRVLSGGD
jgi:hypothetical protein